MSAEEHKFVVVLNKTLSPGVALNTTAHLSAGLIRKADEARLESMHFIDFDDADGGIHASISACSIVVLRARAGQLLQLRQALVLANDVLFTDFIATMTGDTYVEQLARTKATRAEDIDYFGIALFGTKPSVSAYTHKFSLWT